MKLIEREKYIEVIPRQLYFTTSNNVIRTTYQFISINIDVSLPYIPCRGEPGPYSLP